jgi:hypothetical protein
MADQLNTMAKNINNEFIVRLEDGVYILRFRGVDLIKGTLGELNAYLAGWKAGVTFHRYD